MFNLFTNKIDNPDAKYADYLSPFSTLMIRRILIALLVYLPFHCSSLYGKVTSPALSLHIDDIENTRVVVSLKNVSNGGLRIWTDENSWGSARWRILILRKGAVRVLYQNPDQTFTKNNPNFESIARCQSIIVRLDLKDGEWIGADQQISSFRPEDTLLVVYDVPGSPEAWRLKVWHGVIATSITIPKK